MEILRLYEHSLRYVGLTVENDKVYIKTSADTDSTAKTMHNREPFLVNGKQLIIPSSTMLRNIDPNSMAIYHPLSEDIIKGESSIITKIRYSLNIYINIAIGTIAQSLLNLAASPEHHKNLAPEQSELLYTISDVDEKTVRSFGAHMLKEVKNQPDRLFSYIYLKRGGTVAGTKYPRVGIVSFPFYQTLIAGDKYKFRHKDIDAYTAVFKYMFSDIDDRDAYNYGSDSNIAPYFDALMISGYKLTQRLNELLELYSDYIDGAEELIFDHTWYDDLVNIETYKSQIRSIPNSIVEEPIEVPVAQVPNQGIIYPQQPVPIARTPQPINYGQPNQPMPQQPVLKETSRGIDFNSLRQVTGIGGAAPNPFSMPFANQQVNRPAPYSGDILNRPIMPPMQQQYQDPRFQQQAQVQQMQYDPRFQQQYQDPRFQQPMQYQDPRFQQPVQPNQQGYTPMPPFNNPMNRNY